MQLPKMPAQLDDDIFQILTREENVAVLEKLAEEHELDGRQFHQLSGIFARLAAGVLPFERLVEACEELLKLKGVYAKKVALAVAVYFLWPLSWKLRGVDELIKNLGGEAPRTRPAPPPSAGGAVDSTPVEYPTAPRKPAEEKPTLLGGEEMFVRQARSTIARPGEVEKLLEKDLIRPQPTPRPSSGQATGLPRPPMPHTDVEPRIKGNVIDLSGQ